MKWCKLETAVFGVFIAPPISQIATNQKIAIVVNKNAHGE